MSIFTKVVYADIGSRPGTPVGTIGEFVLLDEPETAKRLYKRLNRNRSSGNYLSLSECIEYAQEIRNNIWETMEGND